MGEAPVDERMELLNQPMAFIGMVGIALLTLLLVRWLTTSRRFPHAFAWGFFFVYVLLVSVVPAWREIDRDSVLVYSLRGVPIGLILASMLSLGSGRREPEAASE